MYNFFTRKKNRLEYIRIEPIKLLAKIAKGKVLVSIGDKKFEQLFLSTYIFYNTGNATLKGQELFKGNPLRIEFQDSQVVSISCDYNTGKGEQITVKQEENNCKLYYDFLLPSTRFHINIIHESIDDKFEVHGYAADFKSPKWLDFSSLKWENYIQKSQKVLIIIALFTSLFYVLLGEQISEFLTPICIGNQEYDLLKLIVGLAIVVVFFLHLISATLGFFLVNSNVKRKMLLNSMFLELNTIED